MTSYLPPQTRGLDSTSTYKTPQMHLQIFNSLLHTRTLTMQITFFTIVASFGLLAAAMPTGGPTGGSCNTGNIFLLISTDRKLIRWLIGAPQCCVTQGDAQTDSTVKTAATLLGIDLTGITGIVGLTCSPITLMYVFNLSSSSCGYSFLRSGLGGTNCAQQPVCCTGTQFNGLVSTNTFFTEIIHLFFPRGI